MKKSVYVDGHNRPDVVQYRCIFWRKHMKLFPQYAWPNPNNPDEVIEGDILPIIQDETAKDSSCIER